MNDLMGNTLKRIEENLEGLNEKDLRFFRIEEFKRNIKRTDGFRSKCPICDANKTDIGLISDKIKEAVSVPGKSRRDYDRLINRLSNHIRKEHRFFPPYYNTYLFSFIGAFAGIILGYLGYKLYPTPDYIAGIAIFAVVLLLGNFWGNKKDRKIRNENRLM